MISSLSSGMYGLIGAIVGGVLAFTAVLLSEWLRARHQERAAEFDRLVEFSSAAQMWAMLVITYPYESKSRNPLDRAAHNLDLRLTQNTWLRANFHVMEWLWRTAMPALAGATEEQRKAITDVLGVAGQLRIGAEPPEDWHTAVSHIAYLAGKAKYPDRLPPAPN